MNHHDLFFKKTFSIRENAADFLQHTLAPELIEDMDLDTLTSVACISDKGGDIAMTTAEKLRQEGMQKGRQKGRQETVIALVRNAGKKGLTEEMIAQIIDLDVDLVRQILNNEPVEIPLHLLSDKEQ
jgi:hypothetical protein